MWLHNECGQTWLIKAKTTAAHSEQIHSSVLLRWTSDCLALLLSLFVCKLFVPKDILAFLFPQSLASPGDTQAHPDPILFFTVMTLIKCNCILTNTNYSAHRNHSCHCFILIMFYYYNLWHMPNPQKFLLVKQRGYFWEAKPYISHYPILIPYNFPQVGIWSLGKREKWVQ